MAAVSPARRRLQRLLAALVAVAVTVVVVALVRGGEDAPAEADEETVQVRVVPEDSGDPVLLDASLFTPPSGTPGADADGRRAAVLLAHGFGGSKADLAGQAQDLAAEGYVVLTYTARGFGRSGGLIHLDSPDHEVADARALVDLLAARPDVRLDGAGDPVVGVAGGSYGGALALLAAGYDDRIDAVVPAITWNDLQQGLFPQAAQADEATERRSPAESEADPATGVFKKRWASLFFAAGLSGGTSGDSSADPACGRFAPEVCDLYTVAATTGTLDDEGRRLLARSSPASVLDRITAPTLLVQGQQDSLFPLDQADATARGLAAAGTEVAVLWIDGGHDATGRPDPADATTDEDADADLTDPALAWFDQHLRGGPDAGTAFEFTLPRSPLGDDGLERLRAAAYPVDGAAEQALALTGQDQTVISPPGGEPTAFSGLPGLGALGDAAGLLGGGFELAALPGASAVFESEALDERVRVVGSPRVRLEVTSSTDEATLFASAWVVSAEDAATLPRRLVAPLRLTGLEPGRPTEVTVALPASVYDVEPGQRVRVVVASTDAAYAVPRRARGYLIGLTGDPVLRLPVVPAEAVRGTDVLVPRPLLLSVGGLILAALLLAGWARLRRRAHAEDPSLGEVPLVVDGLVKEYADGFRAVDGVSWRAERGQVVGLLGPNGAGKTTTMRMLVGLIAPDAGTVHVLGREVGPGSPVLSEVGALIEGPGFLPHLTGRENLAAFWAATGRHRDEAGFHEALEVAGLGTAVDRRVRSYSHGMKQRLGIAQAMLGRPDVLLLDEPTNGLDPPQIKAMRGVLTAYAESGRTVVVSSHLLSEVQQTCTHVVVMLRGRVVLTGAVADLLERTAAGSPRDLEELFMSLLGEETTTS